MGIRSRLFSLVNQALTSPTLSNPTFTGVVHGGDARIGAWGIAFVSAPTGTMANNGAVTLGTALPKIYSDGCYLYLPAGAVVAAGAAGWYWTVMSSTTVGQVFNSVYTTGVPATGTATAFVTTGPGAFTGVTTEQGITLTVPIMVEGASLEHIGRGFGNNTAGNKTFRVRLGGAAGTDYLVAVITTQLSLQSSSYIASIGSAKQVGYQQDLLGTSTPFANNTQMPISSTVDTSAGTTLFVSVQKAVATDVAIIEMAIVRLGSP